MATLTQSKHAHLHWLQQAEDFLQAPAQAFALDWELVKVLRPRLNLVARRGLVAPDALLEFSTNDPFSDLKYGMELYSARLRGQEFRVIQVIAPGSEKCWSNLTDFWAVASDDYRRLRLALRWLVRRTGKAPAPIMPDVDRQRLWTNTIGFLRHGTAPFRKYDLPRKRGVLLLGTPGNGKTTACRWLQRLCRQSGFAWRNVTGEDYRCATTKVERLELFHLDRPGIILFDDLDLGLRDREKFGSTMEHTTFLCELDGLTPRRGAIFLFTSNARLEELDPAFRRPGRIDLVVQFTSPDRKLRAELIRSRWHSDILEHLDLESTIAETDGLSFAELEELRKLMVLHYLEDGEWSWSWAWQTYHGSRGKTGKSRRIGFTSESLLSGSTDMQEVNPQPRPASE